MSERKFAPGQWAAFRLNSEALERRADCRAKYLNHFHMLKKSYSINILHMSESCMTDAWIKSVSIISYHLDQKHTEFFIMKSKYSILQATCGLLYWKANHIYRCFLGWHLRWLVYFCFFHFSCLLHHQHHHHHQDPPAEPKQAELPTAKPANSHTAVSSLQYEREKILKMDNLILKCITCLATFKVCNQ